jgi:hypothetical protein
MSATRSLLRAALAGAAAAVVLSGCGGSSGNDASSSSATRTATTTTTTTTTTASAKADSAFCQQAQQLVTKVQSTLGSTSDQSQLPAQLQQVADALHGVQPPAEIATDWNAFADDIAALGQAYASTNFNDPQSTATFQQTATQLQGKLTAEGGHLESFLGSRCGITATTTAAASTS